VFILGSHGALTSISNRPPRTSDSFADSLSSMYPSGFDDASEKIRQ
jgi:hypothetical protein